MSVGVCVGVEPRRKVNFKREEDYSILFTSHTLPEDLIEERLCFEKNGLQYQANDLLLISVVCRETE